MNLAIRQHRLAPLVTVTTAVALLPGLTEPATEAMAPDRAINGGATVTAPGEMVANSQGFRLAVDAHTLDVTITVSDD